MKSKKICFALFFGALIFSCSNTSGDDLIPQDQQPTNQPTGQNPNPSEKVTYTNTIQGIMANNCTACHGNPRSGGAPTSYTTYSQVKNDINRIIHSINSTSNPMPPSGLMPSQTRNLVQQWKNDGLLEN